MNKDKEVSIKLKVKHLIGLSSTFIKLVQYHIDRMDYESIGGIYKNSTLILLNQIDRLSGGNMVSKPYRELMFEVYSEISIKELGKVIYDCIKGDV